MKKTIYGILALSLLAWLLPVFALVPQWDVWVWRKQLIYWSGLASFLLMTLVMLLAIRPRWLEKPLGGLDKMYHLHKWAGISAVGLAITHYGLKLAKGPMLWVFDEAVKGQRTKTFLEIFRSSAKDLGEWSVWLFAAMILLALWHRFPYHVWRYIHKALGVMYLVIVYHGIVLTPAEWWLQPAGLLIAAASVLGTYCAFISLGGRIGQASSHHGTVLAVRELSQNTFEVVCQLDKQWRHQPGQFAFLTFDRLEGPHPFTIASADQGDGQIRFAIKALGDYTNKLARSITIGQQVTIEGPYGCFNTPAADTAGRQIWIAAGIGVTPFIAWLEGLQDNPDAAPEASLYYCANNEQEAVFAELLQQLCKQLPSIRLHIHLSQHDGTLTAEQIFTDADKSTSVWFCGPNTFSDSLKQQMTALGLQPERFHQELFQMR